MPVQQRIFAVLILAAGALACTWQLTDDPDTFWHLATGRAAVQLHSTLPLDVFSSSFHGHPWLGKDLLADLLLYEAHALAQWQGLAILLALLLTLGATAFAAHVQTSTWLLAGGLWLGAVEITATPRSRLFSTILLPILLALIDRARRLRGPAWLLPGAVTGLWLLLHRGGVVGLGILACALALEVWQTRAWRWPLLALTWALLLALLHPDGPQVWTTVLHLAASSQYRLLVSEFQPLTLHQALQAFPLTLTLAILAGLFALFSLRRGAESRERWLAFVLLLTLLLAGRTPRGMPLLAGAAVFLLTPWLDRALLLLRWPLARVSLALVLGGAAILSQRTRPFGVGPDPLTAATPAIAFATEHHFGKNVMNPLHFGGQLLYAGFAPVIDGRNDQVYPEAFFVRNAAATHSPMEFDALTQEFPPDWVLTANPGPGEAFGFLAQNPQSNPQSDLQSNPQWKLVLWTRAAAIYLPRNQRPELPPIQLLQPADPLGSVLKATQDPQKVQQIQEELRRTIQDNPQDPLPRVWLVMHLHLRGLRQARDAELTTLVHAYPDAPEVLKLLQILRQNPHS